ncbi:hypothetical protein LCGC14_2945500, partial [marine sediment metagenome]
MGFEFTDGFIPKKTVCKRGAIKNIRQEVENMSPKRALLICGKGVYDNTDLVDRLKGILKELCVGVFNGVKPHAVTTTITEGKKLCIELKADLLISIGGGSAHDTAKGIAVLVAEGGNDILDHRVIFEPPDKMEIPILSHPKLPIITIATTLAGAEVIGAAGYTDPKTKLKKIVVDPKLTPRLVIYDPEVALTTPVEVFVSSGMNAFDHCVETIYSKKHQEISDTLAMRAIKLLMDALPRCVQNNDDVEAREKAQMASFMAALAYGNSWLGINHAICHCLGARYGVPHGIANAIMLPLGMRFNLDVTGDRQALIAAAMGIETKGKTDLEAGEAAAGHIDQLNEKLGLPRRLRDVGGP